MTLPVGKATEAGSPIPALAHALNCVPDFVFILDVDGRLTFANYAALTHLGHTLDELRGQPPSCLFSSPIGEIASMFRGDWKGELNAVTREGDAITVAVDNAVIRDEQGQRLGVVSICRDVTREKLLEQQLMATQKMATVSSLAGGIAHEFNNLLTGILGYSELLAVHVPDEPVGRNYLDQIKRAALEATELTRQLSVFSQMAVIERRPCNLDDLLNEAIGLIAPSVSTSIRFINHVRATRFVCEGDPSHLRQALVNLLLNACEAMPTGGVLTTELAEARLDEAQARALGLARAGHYLRLGIRDEGCGMSEGMRRRALEPFFTTKGAAHTGLGLTTAYGIVQKHGGMIQLESAAWQGTTVAVYLPLCDLPATVAAEPAGGCDGEMATVLLVEDEDIPREFEAHVLEGAGYRVLAAEDGEQGLKIFREFSQDIDLIVTDIVMPRLSGDAMVAEIRKTNQPVRVLAVSGYTRGDAAERLRALQVDGFVQKPFTGSVLLEHVRQALGGGR